MQGGQYSGRIKSKMLCWAKYEMTRREPGRDSKEEEEYINLDFELKVNIYGKTLKPAWKHFRNSWLRCLLWSECSSPQPYPQRRWY